MYQCELAPVIQTAYALKCNNLDIARRLQKLFYLAYACSVIRYHCSLPLKIGLYMIVYLKFMVCRIARIHFMFN